MTELETSNQLENFNQSKEEKFILFEVAGRVCGVAAASVFEVAQALGVAAVPNAPAWLLGLSTFRGEPVAMIQPGSVISGASANLPSRNFKTIIFRRRDDEAQLALPVDRITEMITSPDVSTHRSEELGLSSVLRNGTPIVIVDPYEFIEKLREEGR